MAKLLVYGWYGHENLGDELMAEALRQILPDDDLRFVDTLDFNVVQGADAILVGGGSFLYAPMRMKGEGVLGAIASKPIVYVGVGSETDVHEHHAKWLSKSVAAFTRSKKPSEAWRKAAPHYQTLPDLTMCLDAKRNATPMSAKRLLYVPNAELVPTRSAPAYKKPAWEYFKSEISQAFDALIEDGWTITTAPFSDASGMRDQWAAFEVTAMCDKRWKVQSLEPSWMKGGYKRKEFSFESVVNEYCRHSVVLTQRFHGAVIAQATQTPCVVVHHVDKLEQAQDAGKVPYYGFRKDLILAAVKDAQANPKQTDHTTFFPIRNAIRIALGE